MTISSMFVSLINYLTNQYTTEFAVAVLISGPANLTVSDAIWWACDPYRIWCYCQAAKELGIIEFFLDTRDLEQAGGVDFEKAVFEMRWTHARLTSRIDGR